MHDDVSGGAEGEGGPVTPLACHLSKEVTHAGAGQGGGFQKYLGNGFVS